ncbi:rhodopsin, GQ-coupled-like [Babylonia areolata]|uniref:rhodopsin, GQ-coupled-like n=1 Tax=Babylonia areolata TaxID=304850 RepID=UPI003FD2B393
MGTQVVAGVAVAVCCVLSLTVNTLALLVFLKRRRLRIRSHLLPLFHLAAVDLLAVVTWSAISVAIAVADWSPPAELCQAHAYFRTLWNMLHVHTLAVLAIERALRLVKPSRHVAIFVPQVVVFLLVGVWCFDILLSSIPHYGWMEFRLSQHQVQCVVDFTSSVAMLDFEFCVRLALPVFLLLLPCFVLAFCKVSWARREASVTGEILLETSPHCNGPAYGERVARFQKTFREVGVRAVKPTLGNKVFTPQGYVTDSDSDVDNVTAKDLRTPRKVYSLAKREYVLLKTYVVLSCVYVIMWLPYEVLTFVVNYEPDRSVPGWLATLFTCITHCTQFALPLVYLTYNPSFRRCFLKTLRCGGRRKT